MAMGRGWLSDYSIIAAGVAGIAAGGGFGLVGLEHIGEYFHIKRGHCFAVGPVRRLLWLSQGHVECCLCLLACRKEVLANFRNFMSCLLLCGEVLEFPVYVGIIANEIDPFALNSSIDNRHLDPKLRTNERKGYSRVHLRVSTLNQVFKKGEKNICDACVTHLHHSL